eukprot:gene5481-9299_t
MSNKYSLVYFPFPGRGEGPRLCFKMAGIDFNDVHLSFQEFAEKRQDIDFAPFNVLPLLEHGDFKLNGSAAICQYLGRQFKLWPEDPKEDAIALQIFLFMEDSRSAFVRFMFGKEEDKPANLIAAKDCFSKFEKYFLHIVGDKKFIFGDKLNIIDVLIWDFLHHFAMTCGELKDIKKYYDSVSAEEIVAPYLKK